MNDTAVCARCSVRPFGARAHAARPEIGSWVRLLRRVASRALGGRSVVTR